MTYRLRWRRFAAAATALALAASYAGYGAPATASATETGPLTGFVVVIDPGHQLGNHNFLQQINTLVPDGAGGTKPCNTTGAATNKADTYGVAVPEATVNWKVATRVKAQLEALGATVIMTRTANSQYLWGPCVNKRGALGNSTADLLVSLHGDGAPTYDHGFHLLITAAGHKNHTKSTALAKTMRTQLEGVGLAPANYVRYALRSSSSYATLNFSSKPAVIIEMGNMRNHWDARRLTSAGGQALYSKGIVAGIEHYLVATR